MEQIIKLFILLFLISNFDVSFSKEPPVIEPSSSDIEYLAGENVTLTCKSDKPVTWYFSVDRKSISPYRYLSPFQIIENRTVSILQINRIGVRSVGYYYCIEKSALDSMESIENALQSDQASRIYVFVNDPSEPLYIRYPGRDFGGILYENITLPCKPNQKSLGVKLLKCAENTFDACVESTNFSQSLEINSTSNPHEGFTIYLADKNVSGLYWCTPANNQSLDFYHFFHVTVDSMHIEDNNDYHAEGRTLELTCKFRTDNETELNIEWILPTGEIAQNDSRIEIKPQKLETNVFISRLIVQDLNATKDNGVFECRVPGIKSKSISVYIYPATRSEFNGALGINETVKVKFWHDYPEYYHIKFTQRECSISDREAVNYKYCMNSSEIEPIVTKSSSKYSFWEALKTPSIITFEFKPTSLCTAVCAISQNFETFAYTYVLKNDLDNDLVISKSSENSVISVGDELLLTCGAWRLIASELNWYKNDVLIENSQDFTVIRNDTQFSLRKSLYWKEVPKSAQGIYKCVALVPGVKHFESWFLKVEDV